MENLDAPSRSKYQEFIRSLAAVERRAFRLEQSGARIPKDMTDLKDTANNVALAVYMRQKAVTELDRKLEMLEEGMNIQSVAG